jgi:hypothetical protein
MSKPIAVLRRPGNFIAQVWSPTDPHPKVKHYSATQGYYAKDGVGGKVAVIVTTGEVLICSPEGDVVDNLSYEQFEKTYCEPLLSEETSIGATKGFLAWMSLFEALCTQGTLSFRKIGTGEVEASITPSLTGFLTDPIMVKTKDGFHALIEIGSRVSASKDAQIPAAASPSSSPVSASTPTDAA